MTIAGVHQVLQKGANLGTEDESWQYDNISNLSPGDNNLVIQSSDLSLMNINALAETGSLDLSPKFQRRNRWDRARQSRLIESFIINAPVPPVYLAEERQGQFTVIDGKQRLTAISRYLNDEFPLVYLPFLPELEGLRFTDLPLDLQSLLRMRPLRCVTIMRQTPEWMKFEVFLRLNTGGQPLNAQELRNVAFAGPLNELLIDLSEHPFLKQQLKIKGRGSTAYSEMDDVEYVLRFFAMAKYWRHFDGDLGGSMNAYMRDNERIGYEGLNELSRKFHRSLESCAEIWGENAFHRWDPLQKQWRNQLIGGMFDAQMVAVDLLTAGQLKAAVAQGESIYEATKMLFAHDSEFDSAVRVQTNTPRKVHYRIDRMHDVIMNNIKA